MSIRLRLRLVAVAGLIAVVDILAVHRAEASTSKEFTCSFDSESSYLEVGLASGLQQVAVRGRLRYELDETHARIIELQLTSSPVPFRGRTAELELLLDPATPAIVQTTPFASNFFVPTSLLLTTDPEGKPIQLDAWFQGSRAPEFTGLISGYFPDSVSRSTGFLIPVLCEPAAADEELGEGVPLLQVKTCGCYLPSDCGKGQTCKYHSPGCAKSGKKDGLCQKSSFADSLDDVGLNSVGAVLNIVFQAYIETASAGEDGLPDRELMEEALDIELPSYWRRGIRDTVFNALDLVVGFDISHPLGDCLVYDLRCFSQFRIPIDPSGVALLEAVRKGFSDGIAHNDASSIERALEDFWRTHSYEPHHTGRCYPHGHPELGKDNMTTIQCQLDGLNQMLADVLTYAKQGEPPLIHNP